MSGCAALRFCALCAMFRPSDRRPIMATVKRTTTTYRAPQRPAPQPEQPIYDEPSTLPEYAPDNQWPDVPEQTPVSDVVPVGVEQLARSQEMQAMGIANWVAAHDERGPDYQQEQVAGVTPLER
jgi:hypothetical protein